MGVYLTCHLQFIDYTQASIQNRLLLLKLEEGQDVYSRQASRKPSNLLYDTVQRSTKVPMSECMHLVAGRDLIQFIVG